MKISEIRSGDTLLLSTPFNYSVLITVIWSRLNYFSYHYYNDRQACGVIRVEDLTFYTIKFINLFYNPRTMVMREYNSGR